MPENEKKHMLHFDHKRKGRLSIENRFFFLSFASSLKMHLILATMNTSASFFFMHIFILSYFRKAVKLYKNKKIYNRSLRNRIPKHD